MKLYSINDVITVYFYEYLNKNYMIEGFDDCFDFAYFVINRHIAMLYSNIK